MHRLPPYLCTICGLFLLLAACAPQPLIVTHEPATLRLVTADACQPLAQLLEAAYEQAHPWITIYSEAHNTALAQDMLQEGQADIALLTRLAEADRETLWGQPLTRAGIAIIVHPQTPLSEISLGLLQEIYRGRVQEWEGAVLAVVSREAGSGTRAAFDGTVLQGRDITLTAVVMPSSEAVIAYVAQTPGSLGYVSTLRLNASEASGVRVLPVEGVSPTAAAIESGDYALTHQVYIATVGEPTGKTRELAQWILSPAGRRIVQDTP